MKFPTLVVLCKQCRAKNAWPRDVPPFEHTLLKIKPEKKRRSEAKMFHTADSIEIVALPSSAVGKHLERKIEKYVLILAVECTA